jgi:predicted dehydrogenase
MPTSIRVGLIGLGLGTADLAPGLWGAKAHLPYLLASPKYQLVAVANSTVESALKAIEYHNLSSEVKAYGSPSDLANDPNVDLVIVCVGVSKHYKLTKPALLAGKDVFVEWPLGASLKEAEELEKMAKEKGVKTIMGLQARASPLVVKVKQLVEKGEIGKVLSTTVVGSFAPFPHDIWPVGAEYYLDKDSGGNPLTINFGHCMFRPFPAFYL